MTNWRDEYDTAIVERNKLIQENVALRAELDAARQWRPVTMPLPVTDADIEIVLKARVNDQGLWAFRTMVPVVAWRLDPDAPDDGQEARP